MNDNGAWTDRRDDLLAQVVRHGRARKFRRWSLGVASVAVAAAVVAIGVASAASGPERSVRVTNPDGSTTTVPTTRAAPVLLVGDSVMLGARAELERALPGAFVDAKVSRQFWDAIPLLGAYRKDGLLPRTIVVHLGNNGAFTDEQFTQVMQAAGSDTQVYFVTTKMPRSWEVTVNSEITDAVPRSPNAHLLDWSAFADKMPWFAADGFHLAGDGPARYAQFIRDGIRPEPTTFSDPFAGGDVPSSGLYVTNDPKWGEEQGPSSFAVTLFDDGGTERGELPRAVIANDAFNANRRTLVVTDDGIRLAATQLETGVDLPEGCTQTEHGSGLAVALCGPRFGDQLLGDRIIVDRGAGWTDLIASPPLPPGTLNGGHWVWASPSPDGRWVLAVWSGECEVITGMFVNVGDGSVHTLTGEAGTAWGNAPTSGALGWAADGRAYAVLGGMPGCGSGLDAPRGVYLVSPDSGARELLIPISSDGGAMRWTAVDDRRTRREAEGSPALIDLDGDRLDDVLHVIPEAIGTDGPITLRAELADGRVLTGSVPSGSGGSIVGVADIAGDARNEVFLAVGGNTWDLGAIVVPDGDRLVAITQTPDEKFIGWGQHSNADIGGTVDVGCATVRGQRSLVLTSSVVTLVGGGEPSPEARMNIPDAQLERRWERSVYGLDGARLVRRFSDRGVLPMTASLVRIYRSRTP